MQSKETIESKLIKSKTPLNLRHDEETSVFNQRGIWVNKEEVESWRGPIPITDYQLNEDPNPEIIHHKLEQPVEYNQDISVKYLKPPSLRPHGDLVIKEEDDIVIPSAPPHIVRMLSPRPRTPPKLLIHEQPPQPPKIYDRQVVTIPGKIVGPAPRKVIIEHMPPIPAKPQKIIVEKWLPFETPKRRIVHERAAFKAGPVEKVKNLEIYWEKPDTVIKKNITDLTVIEADPRTYKLEPDTHLLDSSEMPRFASDWNFISKLPVTSNQIKHELERLNLISTSSSDQLGLSIHTNKFEELEGDLDALDLIDLDKLGLSHYRNQINYNHNNSNQARIDYSSILNNSALSNNNRQINENDRIDYVTTVADSPATRSKTGSTSTLNSGQPSRIDYTSIDALFKRKNKNLK